MIKNKTFISIFFTLSFVININITAQNSQGFDSQISKLVFAFVELKQNSSEVEIKSQAFYIDSLFSVVLSDENLFWYDYSALNDFCSVLESDDNQLRIISWNTYFNTTGEYFYFGYIQYYDKNKKKFSYFKLNDASAIITNPDIVELTANKWFGCIYYELITKKVKKNTYYTLLGWDGNNLLSTKKIVEVLNITSRGPRFGYDFNLDGVSKKRIIFEYSKQVTMSLKWNEKKKMIIWDHLSPSEPKYNNMFQYYGPDFSNDGLVFRKKKWLFVSDISVNND